MVCLCQCAAPVPAIQDSDVTGKAWLYYLYILLVASMTMSSETLSSNHTQPGWSGILVISISYGQYRTTKTYTNWGG